MGTRAILRWTNEPGPTQRLYAHWASPEYKVTALADYLQHAADTATLPSLDHYLAHAAAHPDADHFREPYPAAREPGDLDWVYRITVTRDGDDGWQAMLVIDRVTREPHRRPRQRETPTHHVRVTQDDASQAHALAARLLSDLAVVLRRYRPEQAQTARDLAAAHTARAT